MQKYRKYLSAIRATCSLSSSPYCCHNYYTNSHTINNVISNNQRLNQLLRSGLLSHAFEVFDHMPQRDAVSYNSMIAGCARVESPQRALQMLKLMIASGLDETPQTYPSLIASCADAGLCVEGTQLHCRVISLGFSASPFVGSALICLYMNTDLPYLGLRVFRELPQRTTATYNSLLCGLCDLGLTDQLLRFFVEMEMEDRMELNALSFSYLIRGCYSPDNRGSWLNEGKQLHCYVIKTGWVHSDIFISNALVDLYSASGNLTEASRSFDCIPKEDVISWNSIVAVFADNWLPDEALEHFRSMLWYDKRPSIRSIVSLLNLSSRMSDLLLGIQIHGFVVKSGSRGSSLHVQSALIDMYGKCLDIESSVVAFDEIVQQQRSVECCNSLMTSLLHCKGYEKATELFGWMMAAEGVKPDYVTLSAMIKALSVSSAPANLGSCRTLHCLTIKCGLNSDVVVGCSLINAYVRAGNSSNVPCQIFNEILDPNVTCFTALITAYARNGMGREGVELLHYMIERGLKPDCITFLSVLSGCDHCGMVEEGISVFESMESIRGVEPDQRHYSCMVSLLGRAGLLEEAAELMTGVGPSSQMWSSLLHSCRLHRNEQMGRKATEALMELKPRAAAICLQIASFYSEIDDFVSSARVCEIMNLAGLWREKMEIGCSSVEVKRDFMNGGHES